jgi:hypothetical protein
LAKIVSKIRENRKLMTNRDPARRNPAAFPNAKIREAADNRLRLQDWEALADICGDWEKAGIEPALA